MVGPLAGGAAVATGAHRVIGAVLLLGEDVFLLVLSHPRPHTGLQAWAVGAQRVRHGFSAQVQRRLWVLQLLGACGIKN